MFRPITGSGHGPKQPFSQPVNREGFRVRSDIAAKASSYPVKCPVAWVETTIVSGIVPSCKVRSMYLITFCVFDCTVCDLLVVTGKC